MRAPCEMATTRVLQVGSEEGHGARAPARSKDPNSLRCFAKLRARGLRVLLERPGQHSQLPRYDLEAGGIGG